MATEAERLASIVSYTRDKTRLMQQAANWREQATALRQPAPAAEIVSLSARPWDVAMGRGRRLATWLRPHKLVSRVLPKGLRLGRTAV